MHCALKQPQRTSSAILQPPDDESMFLCDSALGYSAAYAQLHNAHKPERDPLPDVPDAAIFLAKQLGGAAAAAPGTLPGRIAAALPPDAQQQLQALLQGGGVALS